MPTNSEYLNMENPAYIESQDQIIDSHQQLNNQDFNEMGSGIKPAKSLLSISKIAQVSEPHNAIK